MNQTQNSKDVLIRVCVSVQGWGSVHRVTFPSPGQGDPVPLPFLPRKTRKRGPGRKSDSPIHPLARYGLELSASLGRGNHGHYYCPIQRMGKVIVSLFVYQFTPQGKGYPKVGIPPSKVGTPPSPTRSGWGKGYPKVGTPPPSKVGTLTAPGQDWGRGTKR